MFKKPLLKSLENNPTAFSPLGGPMCPHKKKKKSLENKIEEYTWLLIISHTCTWITTFCRRLYSC